MSGERLSRANAERRTRLPRGRRSTLVTIVAVLGLLVSAAAATEAISLAARRRTIGLHVADVARFGRDTHLDDTVVLVVAAAAFVVGVLLVLAAVVPARRRLVELVETDQTIAGGLTVRSFRRTLAAAALDVDGISNAKVSGRRRLRIKVVTFLRNTDGMAERVRDQVTLRLHDLNPAKSCSVRVNLRRKED